MSGLQQNIADAVFEILRSTNDGDDLSPLDLSLVQSTVNNGLTERGEIALYDLLENVRSGYKPQWFHGIEHLTIDHEGFVHWKNRQVEHYDLPWAYSETAGHEAEALAERCRHLEASGVHVNPTTAIWQWHKYAPSSDTEDNQ